MWQVDISLKLSILREKEPDSALPASISIFVVQNGQFQANEVTKTYFNYKPNINSSLSSFVLEHSYNDRTEVLNSYGWNDHLLNFEALI